MLLGVGRHTTRAVFGMSGRSTFSQEMVETKSRRAARAAIAAIARFAAPSRLCLGACEPANGKATSWNITAISILRRAYSHERNGKFIAFIPKACGTYWTRIR